MLRAFEQRVANNREMNELRERVAQLEESREGTERDVLRLQTANEFAVQLLAGRLQKPIEHSNADRDIPR